MIKKKNIQKSGKSPRVALGQDKEYAVTLAGIKKQIQEAQIKAVVAANKELAILYWSIGEIIVKKQRNCGWGTKVIDRLAGDVQRLFPGLAGFSRANIFKMRAFYSTYENCLTAVRQVEKLPIFKIPWGHNVILLTKLENNNERLWYAQKTLEYGWSRSVLETWIESDLYGREGKAICNFSKTLPAPQSDLAQQSLKDPYLFDFLTLHKDYSERDIEQGLIDHIQKFLIELGEGFAFVGRQYRIEVEDEDNFIDLLFYHLKLRCFVVVELKARAFDPRDAGQMNFYLSAVDDQLKHKDDNPTIGLLLCKYKKKLKVEYALRGSASPIGVASYETKLVESLPKSLKGSLPSVEEIEAELEKQV